MVVTRYAHGQGEKKERVDWQKGAGKPTPGLFTTRPLQWIGSGRGTVGKCAGPKWSKMVQATILAKMALFRTGF